MDAVHVLRRYAASCVDPATGQTATFQFSALTVDNADMQARDGFFGLLGVDERRRAELYVKLRDLGPVLDAEPAL